MTFVKAKVMHFMRKPTVKEVEAAGLLEAMRWVSSLVYQNVEFESNAKGVVDALQYHL